MYDFLDSKLFGNNDYDLFLKYSVVLHLIGTECQLGVIVLDTYFLIYLLSHFSWGEMKVQRS